MNNLTKIVSLPGSGGGTMSALPAEVGTSPKRGKYSHYATFPLGGYLDGAKFHYLVVGEIRTTLDSTTCEDV